MDLRGKVFSWPSVTISMLVMLKHLQHGFIRRKETYIMVNAKIYWIWLERTPSGYELNKGTVQCFSFPLYLKSSHSHAGSTVHT